MPDITVKSLPPMPFAASKDAALRNVAAPPRFRLPSPPSPLVPSPDGEKGSTELGARSEATRWQEVRADAPEDKALREAAQQFESFFIGYLLKGMRKGVGEKGGVLAPSEGEKIFRDMMDDETARAASAANQLGIADLLYRELAPAEDKAAVNGGPAAEGKKQR